MNRASFTVKNKYYSYTLKISVKNKYYSYILKISDKSKIHFKHSNQNYHMYVISIELSITFYTRKHLIVLASYLRNLCHIHYCKIVTAQCIRNFTHVHG